MSDRIDRFVGEHHYLSNFYIEPDGTHVEGEYQAAKSPVSASLFFGLTPGQAKRLGKKVDLRPDWESVKLQVMLDLVTAKFLDHPTLAQKLRATGNAELIEGNQWGDTYWGVCYGVGWNNLGKILMQVRDLIKLC